MKKLLVSTAAIAIIAAASLTYAASSQSAGTIRAIDLSARTLTLDDGQVYSLPSTFDATKLTQGERVTVSFETQGGRNLATNVAADVTTAAAAPMTSPPIANQPMASPPAGSMASDQAALTSQSKVTGTIRSMDIDRSSGTFTLSDGKIYVIPSGFDATTLKKGERVDVVFTTKGGKNIATDVAADMTTAAAAPMTSPPAMAADQAALTSQSKVTGTIRSMDIDRSSGTVTLSDGKIYVIPSDFDAGKLKKGETVDVVFTSKGGKNIATSVAASMTTASATPIPPAMPSDNTASAPIAAPMQPDQSAMNQSAASAPLATPMQPDQSAMKAAEAAGLRNVKIVENAVVLQATTRKGEPVYMIVDPAGATEAFPASAHVTGSIQTIDDTAHTVTLDNGQVYQLPKNHPQKFKQGEKVLLRFQPVRGQNLIVAMSQSK